MYPHLHIFGLAIPTYWLLGLLGAGMAFLLIFLRNKRKFHLPGEDIMNTIIYSVIGALIGAKILFLITMIPSIIENFDWYLEDPKRFLNLLQGGIVYYGGLYGGILGGWMYLRRYKLQKADYADLIAPGIPMFHIFGRIGCFFAGCCYGFACDYGIAFTEAIGAPSGIKYFPIQLVEAGLNIVIVAIMLLTEKKRKRGNELKFYLLLYAVMRFCIEFFRGDEVRGHLWIFSTSQWIALITLVVLFILAVRPKRPAMQLEEAASDAADNTKSDNSDDKVNE